ncbi:unnamed protein product [Pleuronectes platessa]|uniref:Uncharacterized protein n=1 Tax=Pleuronectes platessa TaxID=8262 RepID=A0A9N7UBW2_PLEPL|nr:unnamed protein product [Pleuronectes platessa]
MSQHALCQAAAGGSGEEEKEREKSKRRGKKEKERERRGGGGRREEGDTLCFQCLERNAKHHRGNYPITHQPPESRRRRLARSVHGSIMAMTSVLLQVEREKSLDEGPERVTWSVLRENRPLPVTWIPGNDFTSSCVRRTLTRLQTPSAAGTVGGDWLRESFSC